MPTGSGKPKDKIPLHKKQYLLFYMGFWQGMTQRIGLGIIPYSVVAAVILTVSMYVGKTEKIMVYSSIIVPIASIFLASIYYIKF